MARANTAVAPTLAELEVAGEDENSVADSLKAVMEGYEAKDDPEGDAPAETQPETAPEASETTEEAKAEGTDKKPTEKPEEAKAEGVKEGEPEEGAETIEPPSHWTAKEHEVFLSAPREVQKMMLTKVDAAEKAVNYAIALDRHWGELNQVLEPHRDAWARDGFTEAGMVRQLLAISEMARTKPTEFISWFAQQRGIDLGNLQQTNQSALQQHANDPVVRELTGELNAMRREVATLKGEQTQRQQWEQQQFASQMQSQINDFRMARDEGGRLKHPYFDQVRFQVGALLEKGVASSMEQAYEIACNANSDVSAKIAAAKRAREQREREKAERDAAAAALKTGSSVSGQPAARSEPTFTGDLRDDLRADFARRGISL